MWYLTHLQHLTQHFRYFNRSSTNQHRSSGFNHLLHFLNYGLIFFTLSLIYTVVHVYSGNRTVCGDLHNIQFINIPELPCFRNSRTRHTRQFVIHTEIILQGNSCKRLCGCLYLYMFLCLYSLMKSVTPTATIHNTSGLLVNDLHLTIYNDIFIIFVKHRISLKKLLYGMHTFTFHGIIREKLIFLHHALFICQCSICFQRRHSSCNIRQNEQIRIRSFLSQPFISLISQIYTIQLLIYNEIKRFNSLWHSFVIILHVNLFCLQHTGFNTLLRQIFNQRFVLWKSFMASEQL